MFFAKMLLLLAYNLKVRGKSALIAEIQPKIANNRNPVTDSIELHLTTEPKTVIIKIEDK